MVRAGVEMQSPSIWIKNPGVQKLWRRPVGRVRRRRSNAALVSDFLSLRKTLFLCKSCERRMPMFWKRRYGYWAIAGFHADYCRCDSCQQTDACNIYHAEGGGYLEEHFRSETIQNNARSQQIAVRDGRRIKGVD